MTMPDPADTLSGNLAAIRPPHYDTGGELTVLDPRFPIEWTLQSRIWQDVVRDWDGHPGFVLEEVARATEQDTLRKVFRERRWVQTLPTIDVSPSALPPPQIPVVPYQELAEPALTHEWDTGPGMAIPAAPEPRKHRRRGPGGRFIPRGEGAA